MLNGTLMFSGKIVSLPIKEPRTAAQKNGLFISFCIFLTGLMLIAIIALKWNKMKFWKREETVSEG